MPHSDVSLIPVFTRCFGSWQVRVERRPLAPEQLAAAYDKAAPRWSRLTHRFGYGHAYRHVFERFFSTHALDLGGRALRVLDCGVGSGDFSLALAEAWQQPLRLDGVDLSSAMVATAQARLTQAGVDASITQANASTLPFEDDSFDLVISAHMLEHLAQPADALSEIHRVLRPGGTVISCMTRESWLGTYIQTKWRTHRVTQQRAADWLQAAGLIVSETDNNTPSPGGWFHWTSLTAIAYKQLPA